MLQQATAQLQQSASLPDDVCFHFDPECEAAPAANSGRVAKTARRTVVSLEHGCFQVHETVRQQTTADGQRLWERSAQLAELVPRGGGHAFDLIAYVGLETYLHGRSLEDVRQTLAERQPALHVPLSTLWDQQQRFLFGLGRLHEQATPVLRDFLASQSQTTWMLDGTVEPGTPVFLGIEDAASGMLLGDWKLPSENVIDIAACLAETVSRFGPPAGVLHDLSSAMLEACDRALPGVAHRVCHFHLARDVGSDLCVAPQIAFTKRHRSLKIMSRLSAQRRDQTAWLRKRLAPTAASPAPLVLHRLLAGEGVANVPFRATLGHEVLLAFHYWILDYRHDGRRRGFPFDPYTLYLHRRLVRAGDAVDRLLSQEVVGRQAPPVLHHFRRLLTEYRNDPEIVRIGANYEQAYAMFGRLREALQLTAEQMKNLHQPYDLPDSARERLRTALHTLRATLREQVAPDADGKLAKTVLKHLDKYWSHLVPEIGGGPSWPRTTNQLESDWCRSKRQRRHSHGRGKLTRDFQSLPAEYLLVGNLTNATGAFPFCAPVFSGVFWFFLPYRCRLQF